MHMGKVYLICGRICCGKTTYAHQLRKAQKAVLLSCDEVMLSVLDEYLGERHEVYAARTEAYLLQKSLEILETGIPVVLDWGPWTADGRNRLKAFYKAHGHDCEVHAIQLNEQEWQRRIAARNTAVDAGLCQAYHVDEGLMRKFLERYQELLPGEADAWIENF